MKRTLVVLGLLALVTSACTAGHPAVTDTTVTSVQTLIRPTPLSSYIPAPATSAAPLSPQAAAPAGEVDRPCPYIASSKDQGPNSMANLEGDLVYRTTVLTTTTPVGCRFFFWADPFEATADIVPRTFASPQAARRAMIATGEAGTEVEGIPNIVRGVDAVLYRTTFFGPDGPRDWACAFAKGRVMVVVHTQRYDQSSPALSIAQAIADKF